MLGGNHRGGESRDPGSHDCQLCLAHVLSQRQSSTATVAMWRAPIICQ